MESTRIRIIPLLIFVIMTTSLLLHLSHNKAGAAVWHVKTDGLDTSDCAAGGYSWGPAFKTIQQAIDCAADGDEVWVREGVYLLDSQITVGKPVHIYGGFDGSEVARDQRDWRQNVTTVDGQNTSRCFRITADATVDGFTITGGNADGSGGGILNELSSPVIANNVIRQNSAIGSGGGIRNTGSSSAITSPTIVNCQISENFAGQSGGGIDNFYSSPIITNCTLWQNTVGEAGYGGGIRNFMSAPSIINATITGNTSEFYGGGVFNNLSNSTITNTIVYGNSAATAGDEIQNIASNPSVTYSDVRGGYQGEGNINSDPLFVNSDAGNFHLLANSPCIDAGNDAAVPADIADLDGDSDTDEKMPVDLDGEPRFDKNVDMGAYEYVHQPDIAVTDSVVLTDDLWIPFGAVQVGNFKEETVSIANAGSAALIIGDIASIDPVDTPFSIDGSSCSGVSLDPGESCTLTVTFAPIAEQRFSDTFDIPSSDPDEQSVTVSVSGIGTPEPQPNITVSDSTLPSGDLTVLFGNVPVGDPRVETVTIANTGELTLTTGSISLDPPISDQFSIDGSTCSDLSLDPGESCTFTVTFRPSDLGTYSDNLDIPSNDPDEGSVRVEMTGTAAQYTLTVAIDPSDSGTVKLYPPDGVYGPDTVVTLVASANQGWVFRRWSGDVISLENPVTITMDSEKSLTANFLKDSDLDGVSDEDENARGDGNNDGISDSTQANVASLYTYDGLHQITLVTSWGTLSECRATENPDPSSSPGGVEFPYGLFDFVISGLTPGGAVTMTVYLPSYEELDTYYKYGPTPGQPTNHWYKFMFNGLTGAWIRSDYINLYFFDGQRGDDDRLVNGIIVDQGGPGSASTDDSSGSTRGCFISTAAFDSPVERYIVVLREFRDRFLLTNMPGRTF